MLTKPPPKPLWLSLLDGLITQYAGTALRSGENVGPGFTPLSRLLESGQTAQPKAFLAQGAASDQKPAQIYLSIANYSARAFLE